MCRLPASGRALLAALIALACGGSDSTGPVVPANIVIVPNHPTLPQGLTLQLQATVVDASGRAIPGLRATFESADTTIAKVTTQGLVTSVGPIASVRITAAHGGLTGFVDLEISQRIVGLEVTPPSLVLNTNSSAFLSATVVDYVGDPVTRPGAIGFVSRDPNIAAVADDGLVTAFSIKSATTITVTADTFEVIVPVTVTQIPATIEVSPQSVVVPPGGSEQLTTVVHDILGQVILGAAVAYLSNAPALFNVSASGLVTSLAGIGSGTITVTSDLLQTEVEVIVSTGPVGIVVQRTLVPGPGYASAVHSSGAMVVSLPTTANVVRGTLPDYGLSTEVPVIVAPRGADPLGVAISPSGTTAYAALRGGQAVATIDLASNTQGPPITGFRGIVYAVAVSPDGQYLFVGTSVAVYKVEVSTSAILDSINVPALHFAVHPTQSLLYASEPSTGVVEIDFGSMTLGRGFGPTAAAQAVALAPDGSRLYVADEDVGLVQSYDLATGQPGAGFTTEGGTFGLAVSPVLLVAAESRSGLIEVFDRLSGARLSRLDVGGIPRRPAFSASGDVVAVPNEFGWVDFIR